jgi:hypothetical protein
MQQQRRVTWPPRNARSILEARRRGALKPGDHVAISFVGSTDLDMPHVFVDSGMRYDLGFLEGLHVSVVAAPGIDAQLGAARCARAHLVASGPRLPALRRLRAPGARASSRRRPVRSCGN